MCDIDKRPAMRQETCPHHAILPRINMLCSASIDLKTPRTIRIDLKIPRTIHGVSIRCVLTGCKRGVGPFRVAQGEDNAIILRVPVWSRIAERMDNAVIMRDQHVMGLASTLRSTWQDDDVETTTHARPAA